MKSTSPPMASASATRDAAYAARVARVEREDMVMFINACFACSGQREFYGDARGQSVSIAFLHQYILGNYRRLYARCLAAGINHFNKAQVIVNLLATGAETPAAQRREEGELIYAALCALPVQRAYRVLEALRDRRVNNRRTRAVIRRYLAERHARGTVQLEALKYRGKLRAAAAHSHAALPGELGGFLFRGWREREFTTPLFERYRRAHFARSALYELPYTIAEGFAAKHRIPRDEFLAGIAERMTQTEKLRLQRTAARERVQLQVDLGRVGLTRLASYVVGLPAAERQAQRVALLEAARAAAVRALGRQPRQLGKVAAILDHSYSTSGSSEKRRRPLAVAWAVSQLLRAAAREYLALWTPGSLHRADDAPAFDELLVTARGQTDLATPLLTALEWGAELVLLVSDGYENDPPAGAAEIARVFRKRLDPEQRVSIIHVNPVFDAEHYAPRAIGPALPTVGLRDAEDLLTMLGFARFADGTAPLSELEEYLEARMLRMLRRAAEGAKTDPDPESDPESDPDPESESDPESGPESDAESVPGSGSVPVPDSGSDSGSGSAPAVRLPDTMKDSV